MAELRIVFMDAGQGDSTLVVYPDNSLMLIDCGSTKSKGVVAPEIISAINRYLPKTSGGNTIHTLVLTHPDIDHYNMLLDVTKALNIAPFGRTLKPPLSIRDLLVAPWIDTDLV